MNTHTVKRWLLTVGLLLGVSMGTTPAMAATATFNFTGDVTRAPDVLSPPFAVNRSSTAVNGTMTVDTFDHNTAANRGEFQITSFSMNIEGNHFSQGPPAFFGVETTNGAMISADVTVPTPTGPSVTVPFSFVPGQSVTLVPSEVFIKLDAPGTTGTFTNDALSTTVPSLASFATKTWNLGFAPGGEQVSGEITSLTAVPLPPAAILFGIGLVGLIGLGAGTWRRSSSMRGEGSYNILNVFHLSQI